MSKSERELLEATARLALRIRAVDIEGPAWAESMDEAASVENALAALSSGGDILEDVTREGKHCPVCKKWWRAKSDPWMSCTVLHALGDCCHINETEVERGDTGSHIGGVSDSGPMDSAPPSPTLQPTNLQLVDQWERLRRRVEADCQCQNCQMSRAGDAMASRLRSLEEK